MIHLCGSRSTRWPIVSFHFIPTGIRLLHLGGGKEGRGPGGGSLLGCQHHERDPVWATVVLADPDGGERLTASATLGRVSGRAEGILMPLSGRICADVALL